MRDSTMDDDTGSMTDSSWEEEPDETFEDDDFIQDEPSLSENVQRPFLSLCPAAIVAEQQQSIEKVIEITGLPDHMARTFLQEMKWDFAKLTEFYYEDQDRALAKVGLAVGSEVSAAPTKLGEESEQGEGRSEVKEGEESFETCEVCFDEIRTEQLSSHMTIVAGCGHRFCNECWRRHIKVQIDEGAAIRIRCAGRSSQGGGGGRQCNLILDERVVGRLLEAGSDEESLSKYRRRQMESYVNDNPLVKWCPGTDCVDAVRIAELPDKSSLCTQVECTAGHEWCFVCSGEAHSPADCDMVKVWKRKAQDDSETSNWLHANTQDCPKCKVAINKDGGCNHMHCKQCDHHFCWICLGWFNHTSYQHTCNKYEDKEEERSTIRAALSRYVHHFTRFMAHAKSREKESELRMETVEKMKEMQDKGNKTVLEVQFVAEATSQLIRARRFLQWSYVVGFSEPQWLCRNIFDWNQSELEGAVEQLSFIFENTKEAELCEQEGRMSLIDQTQKVRQRHQAMRSNLEGWKAAAYDADEMA
eukprot:CAMPEP_0181315586 /NCGR_PEP_ID=MMETSP1101-20121128/15456_1 /TAXON_ID=46948 /ORGANISM="Rhodomonas abbreviata, Strain Caron Lab Isolate" /LENGTH=529 /DNA_ID=CAMNT_0023422807 /DNA_START=41 /DNA_END=1630 /DNA_ORIENTATION=+